jgi:hypothetical protein
MFVTTMVNFGWSPTTYCGWLVMPLTASVESGQSSPSFSTGGGITAAVGVGVGGGALTAGGTTGVLTSGFSPGSGVGAAACVGAGLTAFFVSAPEVFMKTMTTTAAMTPITRTAMPSASALRRQ